MAIGWIARVGGVARRLIQELKRASNPPKITLR
jgi:hypothetical protein